MSELEGPELDEVRAVAAAVEDLIGHTLEVAETLRRGAHIRFERALDVMTTLGESVEALKELRDELRKATRARADA